MDICAQIAAPVRSLLRYPSAPTVLHLHIPRTGGCTLQRYLRNSLRWRGECLTKISDRYALCPIKSNIPVALISGHFSWGLHTAFPDSVYVVVLREPVERVRSIHSYISQNRRHPKSDIYNRHSIPELLKPHCQLVNGQTRQLSGQHASGREMSVDDLGVAKLHLSQDNVVLLTTESLQKGMVKLTERLQIPPPVVLRRHNKSVKAVIDAETRGIIAASNTLDIALYDWALGRSG